ncbi:5-methyltetrahydropteroyltriglutamate--homocysteine S-methyltransferase [Aerococcaceae bacterium DSM 111020]|nr:5-methyltetrahydropteroyltriglutamate--homocysteine S-methyltransferase [Aerococcaceae bacterium DSM 111020]
MTQKTAREHAPYRFETVGSFLRPANLLVARQQFSEGKISAQVLKAVEDAAIIDLIKKQEAIGLKSISDGEFRRSWWHLDFFWGLNGVEKTAPTEGYHFNATQTRSESAKLIGKINGENHPFVDHFKFVRDHISENSTVKQTIPAPAQFVREIFREQNLDSIFEYYADIDAFLEAVAEAYHQVLSALYEAGARVVQLDDCTWGAIVSGGKALGPYEKELGEEKLKEILVTVNNAAIANLPTDLVINTHVCRGNYRSTWFSEGAYTNVASPLFDRENVHGYFLEYDSDRAGGFEPLAKVTPGKVVVLGLITTKSDSLEERQAIIDRIYEAAKYVPLDNLCLSPQCGFASTEEGNNVAEQTQWDKLSLIKSIVDEVWGES